MVAVWGLCRLQRTCCGLETGRIDPKRDANGSVASRSESVFIGRESEPILAFGNRFVPQREAIDSFAFRLSSRREGLPCCRVTSCCRDDLLSRGEAQSAEEAC